jgi:hypothetical protein
MYFPLTAPLDVLITTLAVIGLVACVVKRHLNGTALGVTGLVMCLYIWQARQSLPVLGLLWNPRLLPFLYLVRYLMMVIGAFELMSLGWNLVRDRRARDEPRLGEATGFAVVTALGISIVLGFMYQVLPFDGTTVVKEGEAARYSWGPIMATKDNGRAVASGWSRYNFEGYEGRGAYYTEYHQVVTTMQRIGDDPALGCGRASWENNEENGKYGTTMSLMLLPFWTDGCIGSMEGLFFEASGTTPYHFLTTAAMSKQSSNPVRGLRYVNNDAEIGVGHLRDLGVRYVMVRTTEAKASAAASPDLSLVATAYPWDIYLVQGSSVIEPLTVQPVVVNGRGGDQRERNLELGTSWFQHQDEWAAMPADDGPAAWQRIDVTVDMDRRETNDRGEQNKVDIVVPSQPIAPVALPPVSVTDIQINEQSLEFDVDQPGVPVLVRVSYFPNWKASGADGPYRIAPNMMVVVPTGTHVELHYGRTTTDYATLAMTLIGIGLCVLWRRRGDVVYAGPTPGARVGGDTDFDHGGIDEELDWYTVAPDDHRLDGADVEPEADELPVDSGGDSTNIG